MYFNLSKEYRKLSPEEKFDLRASLSEIGNLHVTDQVMSRKIAGTYGRSKYKPVVNFTNEEKEKILIYFANVKKLEFSSTWLFKTDEDEEQEMCYLDSLDLDKYNIRATRLRLAIRRADDLFGITEDKIIEELKITKNALKNYKSGKTKIRDDKILKLAPVLNVNIGYLMGDYKLPGEYVDNLEMSEHNNYIYELENTIKKDLKNYFQNKYVFNSEEIKNNFFDCYDEEFGYIVDYLTTGLLASFYCDLSSGDFRKRHNEHINEMRYKIFDNYLIIKNIVEEKTSIISKMNGMINDSFYQNKLKKEKDWVKDRYSAFEKATVLAGVKITETEFNRLSLEEQKKLYEEYEKNYLL